jgi:PAS domain S-box-containing protein
MELNMIDKPIKILFFEDNPDDFIFMREMLEEVEDLFELSHAETLEEGLKRYDDGQYDVILLDLGLPDSQGFDTFNQVHDHASRTAIIILTGLKDEELGIRAVKEGAQDYLVKGQVDGKLISKSINYGMERNNLRLDLAQRESNLSAIMENTSDSIWSTDLEGNLLTLNSNFKNQFQFAYGIDLKTGFNMYDDLPNDENHFWDGIHEKIIKNERFSVEKHYEFPNISIDVEISVNPIRSKDGKVIGASFFSRDITERKIYEQKLKDSEEHLRLITDNMNDVIGQMDINGIITYSSPSVKQLSGFEPQEIMGKRNFDFVHPKDLQNVVNVFKDSISTGKSVNVEYRAKNSDGEYMWVESSGKPVYDALGNFESAVFAIRDINDRKKVEFSLLESEKSLNAFINAITESAFMIDAQGNYIIVNETLAKRLKMDKDELIGANAFHLLPDELARTRMKFLNKVIESGESLVFSDERDGIFLQNHIYPMFDEKGKVSRLVIFSMDVTELKIAEKALIQSEEKYRQIIETTQEGVWIIDENANTSYVNQSMEEMLGYAVDEMMGRSLFDFMDDEGKIDAAEKMERRKKGIKERHDFRFKHKEGSDIWTMISTNPIFENGEFKGALGMLSDITERKKMEKSLRESKEFSENVLASMMDGFSVLDVDGIHTDVNQALCDMTGFSRDELIGTGPPHPYWPEEEYGSIQAAFENTLKGNMDEYELIFKRKNGERFQVIVSPSVVKDEKENLISAEATVKDISERKKREDQIKLHNMTLEGINQIFREVIAAETEDEIAKKSLQICEEVTNSKFGFILELNEKGKLDALAISDPGWDECVMEDAIVMIKGMEERGIHGKASRDGVSVLTNDPSNHEDSIGTPEGHPTLTSFLGVPLKQGDEIIGSIGLGNKEDGYDMKDQEILEKLSVALSESLMRKRAETSLKTALDEKELLLKEIHHRVKNNLMIISSLLSLQSHHLKDEETIGIFKESQNRAKSMALIHERLYLSTDLKNIDFREYITTLAKDLYRTYVTDQSRVRLELNIEELNIDINTAIPLGLILNELITNSMKHAFSGEERGTISIDFQKDGDEFKLMVSDDGVGFPENLDFKNTDSLGLELVNTLTDQIDGKIDLKVHNGTKFTISFKETNK